MDMANPNGANQLQTHLLGQVHSLIVARNDDADTPSLDLEIEAEYGMNARIRLRFGNVRRLHLPDLSHGLLQFGECWIEDVSDRGWEYVKYELIDEIEEWECAFETLTILGLDSVSK